ncbi:MAG TPA: 3-hydroxyacyl-CoA dehydrogenase NAD-binding domain-containing protein [Gammaproteobacteria bacterium]
MAGEVSYGREGAIALITIDYPPVNAMSHAVRKGVWDAIERLVSDRDARAAVLLCAGRTWSAGADITEFEQAPRDPWLPQMVQKIEDSPKLVVAAIHGTALGGGLETALGCHYRCAAPSAKLGFPEVNLGLIPGAGGTQRVPRIAGVRRALDLIISGKPIAAREALACGLIDELVEGDLKAGTIACVQRLLDSGAPIRRISAMPTDRALATPAFFADYRREIAARTRGFPAPERVVRAVEAAVQLPLAEGMRRENDLFWECMQSTESKAQRHLFFAEREAAKLPDVPKDTPLRSMSRVAVVGAGTMGGGIAMCFASAGVPVTLLEMNQAALDRGLGAIRRNYAAAVEKGRMDAAQFERTMALLRGSTDYADLADVDLVVEAVFESMQVKLDVFGRLDAVCKPGAILATNTSTLDVDAIARATRRPEDVIGLHFFAPANIMPLLEIVRGGRTASDVLATSMDLAKKIRKIAVVVGVCFGFVANRMFIPYIREAQQMILEGTTPERIDAAAVAFGMAMGPNAVCDLSGIDVFRNLLAEWSGRPDDPSFCRMVDALHGMNRLGQKTGAGFYRYAGRTPSPDPEVMTIAAREAAALGVALRAVDDAEIVERLMCALVNEGARVLEDRIARSPGDIDVIFANGFGFPRWRGGPMFHADTLGLRKVYDAVCRYRERYGDRYWTPAPTLEKLAKAGKSFADL